MTEKLEPSLRHVVARYLGVGPEDLVSDVSLREDLAADSLDLVELAMVLEREFRIVLPERFVEEVHTYGDLLGAMRPLVRRRDEIGRPVTGPLAAEP